jgi:hypothetical protein
MIEGDPFPPIRVLAGEMHCKLCGTAFGLAELVACKK